MWMHLYSEQGFSRPTPTGVGIWRSDSLLSPGRVYATRIAVACSIRDLFTLRSKRKRPREQRTVRSELVVALVACGLISDSNQHTCHQVSLLRQVDRCALLIQPGTHLKEHRREVRGGGGGGGWAGGSVYGVDRRWRHCPVLIGAARWRRHCLHGAAAVAIVRLKIPQQNASLLNTSPVNGAAYNSVLTTLFHATALPEC